MVLTYNQIVMKKTLILAMLVIMTSSCSDNDNAASSTNGKVTLKVSAVSATGQTSLTGRIASTVVLTDFKINIGSIKLETDEDDDRYSEDPSHEDIKLAGPFLLDLLDPNNPLSQLIATVDIPNAKYEEIEFKFIKSIVNGDMYGKTFMIRGTIDGKEFVIWSGEDAELEIDFEDASKDFVVNGNGVSLTIQMKIDAIMVKLVSLAKENLLLDTDGDGIIEITTGNDDDHHDIGELFRELLENETHLDDED
jgi:hypothetical protein